jgi:hypothetical protein
MKAVALAAGTRRLNQVEAAAEARVRAIAEDAARQKALYGKHVDDVRVLRNRGFTVTAEKRGAYLVGNRPCSGDELKAKADRERRLMGNDAVVRKPSVTAGGLKVGQVVALAPKAMNVHQCTLRTSPPRKLSGAAAATTARAAEYSADLGTRPRVVWLDLGLLDVDRRYQREITGAGSAHINRITRGFNWNRYQPIVVTEQDGGRYAVIDGQHRLEAAKKHPLIDSLPCYIIDAPDLAAQAEIFVAVNSDRRALTNLQKFWASVAAGNREAAALAKACEEAGVTIPRTTPQGGLSPRTLIGPNVMVGLIGKLGRDAVLTAIKLLADAWPAARSGFRIANLRAVATITSTAYSHKRLLGVLKGLDPDALYVEALALGGGSGRELASATEKLIRKAMTP